MWKKHLLCVAALFLTMGMITGCRNGEKTTGDSRSMVGITAYSLDDSYTDSIVAALFRKYQSPDSSYQGKMLLEMHDSEKEEETEQKNLERYISFRYDLLMVDPVDCYSSLDLLRYAKKNDIPILFFDRAIPKSTLTQWKQSFYVGPDEEEVAQKQANMIAKKCRESDQQMDRDKDGNISVCVLLNDDGHSGSEFRMYRVLDILEKKGIHTNVTDVFNAGNSRMASENHVDELLTGDGTVPEMVLADSDCAAIGAADAYTHEGKKMIPIFGRGATEDGKKAADEGRITGTVGPDFDAYAKILLGCAEAVTKGKDLSGIDGANGTQTVIVPVEAYD